MSVAIFVGVAAMGAAVAITLVAWPLIREQKEQADGGDEMRAALRARLAAISRDRDSGLIGADAAAEAEIEAQRAALAATEKTPQRHAPARAARLAAIAFLLSAPLAAAGLYLQVGTPGLIDPPPIAAAAEQSSVAAIASLPEDERRAMIENMIAGLAARLDAAPNDSDGWRMLARSQMVLERPAESAESWRRLFALEAGDVEDWRNYATALAGLAGAEQFPTDAEFMRALDEIDRRAPGDMIVLFYRGGAARETGDAVGAVRIWEELLAAMPADAPVRPTLERLIAEAKALSKSVPK